MRGGGGTEVKAEASIICWWGLVELWGLAASHLDLVVLSTSVLDP